MADTVARMFLEVVRRQPDLPAQYSKGKAGTFEPISYADLHEKSKAIAASLLELGVARGDKIGLISDNRAEWLAIDLAGQGIGVADVPRGCDATEQEIRYILSWSECRMAFLENDRQLKKVFASRAALPLLSTIIMIDDPEATTKAEAEKAGVKILLWAEFLAAGKARLAAKPGEFEAEIAKGRTDEIATIIYTSGTTGDPKGVVLTNANFVYQAAAVVPEIIHVKPGDIFMSVLPIWHSFERIVTYVAVAAGAGIAYSKPIGAVMLPDLAAIRPHYFPSVPRIWESVMDGVYRNIRQKGGISKVLFEFFLGVGGTHAWAKNALKGRLPEFHARSRLVDVLAAILPWLLLSPVAALGDLLVFGKIKEKLGGRFIAGISGGGALPPAVDHFFAAIGVLILEGYGLTEAAPLISVRPQDCPKPGTIGPPIPGTELRIVDEQGKDLGWGHKGLILIRGPQVMQGYYKRPDLTAKVIREGGWLDTGDLGMTTRQGEIAITGRAKDTIVLLGGENIEPLPIEQKLCESQYIQTAVVLGQDMKYLAALIVPNEETVTAWAKENTVPIEDYETLIKQPEVIELIDGEVYELVSAKNGFKSFERLFRFTLLPHPFEVGKELSAKQEVKRHAINTIYAKEIAALFKA
ncbi:MAG TPA: long-chain fatty acid--CoA ligase [Rectinemataceae bacterium]|nr:long-chain fatty acid--CoA ligase [Rectinemataceae bacterium]